VKEAEGDVFQRILFPVLAGNDLQLSESGSDSDDD